MINGKVTICGVNTNDLTVLSEAQKTALLQRMANGDPSAREKLINGNLRLVLCIVGRFASRGENMDDLFQVGCIGLMKSIDNFDVSQNVRFSTYAVPMIIGEIRRHLRDNSPVRVSRSIKDTAYKAMRAKDEWINAHHEEPTVSQLAEVLGIPSMDVVLALESIVEPMSLYEPAFHDGGDVMYVLDQIGNGDSDRDWIDEISFREGIKNLEEREKKILTLRFMQGLTQTEVSKEIGISQAQVSRLEKAALKKIIR